VDESTLDGIIDFTGGVRAVPGQMLNKPGQRKVNKLLVPKNLRFLALVDPAEAIRIRALINRTMNRRIFAYQEKYETQNVSLPKVSVKFFRLRKIHLASHNEGTITIDARMPYVYCDFEMNATFDHELTHFFQHKTNKNLSPLRNLLHRRELGRFIEGFAVFVESLDSRFLNSEVVEGVSALLGGAKPEKRVDKYTRGYLRFLAIARATSPKHALELGFSGTVGAWLKASDSAFQAIGVVPV
jgi:hypothetical protein